MQILRQLLRDLLPQRKPLLLELRQEKLDLLENIPRSVRPEGRVYLIHPCFAVVRTWEVLLRARVRLQVVLGLA